jgi:hypothetical protein
MTFRDLMSLCAQYPLHLMVFLVGLPAITAVMGLLHGRGGGGAAPWRYLYSAMVYSTCIPGMLAAVMTGYTLFFTHENLLDVNAVAYFGPIASMVLTLTLIGRNVRFDQVPGFDRLSGLMTIIAVTFVLALAIQRTRIWIGFGGSMPWLIGLAAGLFVVLKWGAHMLFRRRDKP